MDKTRSCRFLAVAAAAATIMLLAVVPAFSGPAMQGVIKTFSQPNGTQLELRLWGDEYANGWETTDGYTVILDDVSGYWHYAALDLQGNIVPSGRRVGTEMPATEPHVRPRAEALEESYIIKGAGPDPSMPRLPQAPPWATGNTNVLVILVQFPADAGDPNGAQPAVNASFTAAQVQANLFGGTSTGPGNMTDYYDEISYNALHLLGTVVGPFTVANDKNDYDDGPSSAGAMVAEAIALADAAIDFAPYDNDGNGQVDMVAIAYAGNGPDNGNYTGADPDDNDLWPHASSIGAVNVDGGARSVSQYFIAPELLNSSPRLRTIGVYCHEFGHKLGLPDLYDTDNSSDGIGHWGLMGSGSWCSNNPGFENGEAPSHMEAWSKWFEGWITPTDLTDQQVAQAIPQVSNNAFAVRLLANPGGVQGPGGSGEYFLIENRQRTGFDIGIDGCGIVVWHIDESRGNNASEGHTAGTHRFIDLEEADSPPDDLDNGTNRGDSGDTFPGSTSTLLWDDDTAPSARLYNGDPSNQSMRIVTTTCGASMTVSFNNAPPEADAGTDIVAECASHTTTSVQLNGTGSSDPDGDTLTYTWSATGIVFDDPSSSTPTGQFPEGATVVTLTVSDGVLSDTDQVTVTVVDTTPPTIACPSDVEVECSSHCGTSKDDPQLVAFFAGVSASDICDDDVVITNDAPDCFPEGETTVTFTATDDENLTSQCTAIVKVVDTTPPVIDVVLDRDALWPPNHKMVEVCATVTVTDICDPDPTFVLDDVTSNELDNSLGDGNTNGDIQDADRGTPDLCVSLRSERQGPGDGREYTIVYEAMDDAGNTATATVVVRVAHDQSGLAFSSEGFSADGMALDPNATRFTLVILSTPDMDATRLPAERLYVGNTKGVVTPTQVMAIDVDADGRRDVALFYPVAQAEHLIATATPSTGDFAVLDPEGDVMAKSRLDDGPVGLHYRTEDGVDYLVSDIFGLGRRIDLPRVILNDPPILAAPIVPPPVEPARIVSTRMASIHPNPFNPQTTVDYELAEATHVRIAIYDVRGALVRRLVDERAGAGTHSALWNGVDDAGRPATSGVYFVRMIAGSYTEVRKIVMLK